MNTYMAEGVGKRIVDALKKQSELEITQPQVQSVVEPVQQYQEPVQQPVDEFAQFSKLDEPQTFAPAPESEQFVNPQVQPQQIQPQPMFSAQPSVQPNVYSQINNNFADFGGLEVPQNVAVLRQLIAQLPSGVSRQAGALVIKQTMEALGISMKSVLQEAQQLQENINMSARDCQNSILECKKQINTLEAQVQKYQKQSASLNDIVSLFIQIN